jgi:hypothetical protein
VGLRPAGTWVSLQVFPEADIDPRRGKVVVWDKPAVPHPRLEQRLCRYKPILRSRSKQFRIKRDPAETGPPDFDVQV